MKQFKNYLDAADSGRNRFWWYLLVLFITIVVMFGVQIALMVVGMIIQGSPDVLAYPPLMLLVITMLPFGAVALVLLLGIRLIHNRNLWTVISPGKRFRFPLFLSAGLLWFMLTAASDVLMSVIYPGNYELNTDFGAIITYTLVAVGLVAVQIFAEELFFRGYLMQGFGQLWKNAVFVIIMQAVLFGLLHGINPEVEEYGLLLTMPFYIGMGLLLGFLTLKTNGLEAALGIHFFNNMYATTFVTFEASALTSPALFMIQDYKSVASLLSFFIISALFLAIYFGVFDRSKAESKIDTVLVEEDSAG